jgi:hypothetical protein
VEFNDKQVHLIPHKKMVLRNMPNRTIMELARSMILAQGLGLEFWGGTVNTAV